MKKYIFLLLIILFFTNCKKEYDIYNYEFTTEVHIIGDKPYSQPGGFYYKVDKWYVYNTTTTLLYENEVNDYFIKYKSEMSKKYPMKIQHNEYGNYGLVDIKFNMKQLEIHPN